MGLRDSALFRRKSTAKPSESDQSQYNMASSDDIDPNHTDPPTFSHATDNDPPPAYTPSKQLALVQGGERFPQQTLQMIGDSRSPDFVVGTSTQPGALFEIETDSTLVYHETSVKSAQNGFTSFFMKRKQNGAQWMYTVEIAKKKVLEIETGPDVQKAKSKLVFRNFCIDELDAIYMQPSSTDTSMDVLHRSEKIGSIKSNGVERAPEYNLEIIMPGVDPILLVILAVVWDDRSMTQRRRLRRPRASGITGVGKGPGAGLAGAYAIGAGF